MVVRIVAATETASGLMHIYSARDPRPTMPTCNAVRPSELTSRWARYGRAIMFRLGPLFWLASWILLVAANVGLAMAAALSGLI